MPGLELHGVREDELGRDIELWAEEESSAEEEYEEEGGPGPPLGGLFVPFSFVFSFVVVNFFGTGDAG